MGVITRFICNISSPSPPPPASIYHHVSPYRVIFPRFALPKFRADANPSNPLIKRLLHDPPSRLFAKTFLLHPLW